jgi:hypothetical protein
VKAILEGDRQIHAIVLEEVRAQLRDSIPENSRLAQTLNDKHRATMMDKKKELDGARKSAELANKQLEACRSVIQDLHSSLLGKCFQISVCLLIFQLGNVELMHLVHCRHAAPLAWKSPLIPMSFVVPLTPLESGHAACASVEIARASELSARETGTKLELVPELVEDWKISSARGGARTALALAKAHYSELDLDIITSKFPKKNENATPVDGAAIR